MLCGCIIARTLIGILDPDASFVSGDVVGAVFVSGGLVGTRRITRDSVFENLLQNFE